MTEFTVCGTFVAPVSAVLTFLPKVPLDTPERREGYLRRLHGLPDLLTTAAERHTEGIRAGRTSVARLVESAAAQVDVIGSDAGAGGLTRPDQAEDEEFARQVASVVDEQVRPALAAYRDRLRADVLPARATTIIRVCAICPTGSTCTSCSPGTTRPWRTRPRRCRHGRRDRRVRARRIQTSVHGSGA